MGVRGDEIEVGGKVVLMSSRDRGSLEIWMVVIRRYIWTGLDSSGGVLWRCLVYLSDEL